MRKPVPPPTEVLPGCLQGMVRKEKFEMVHFKSSAAVVVGFIQV